MLLLTMYHEWNVAKQLPLGDLFAEGHLILLIKKKALLLIIITFMFDIDSVETKYLRLSLW